MPGSTNFASWMIDGSTAAKKKLTYEGELVYLRTAPKCVPKVQLWDFISMKPYVTTNANNLFHVTLRVLLALFDPEYDTSIDSDVTELQTEMNKYAHKIVGAGADGAAVNFGRKNGLLVKWKQRVTPWLFTVHCFAHRLELAVEGALGEIYGAVNAFLTEIYLHFRNSSKEWCSVLKVGDINNLQIVSIPKPFGTRFVAHVKNALKAVRNNWAPLIVHFSNKKATANDEQSAGYLQKYFLNFEFFLDCCAFEDILEPLSLISLAVQADSGSSLAEAAQLIDNLRLKLSTLEAICGSVEQETLHRYEKGTADVNDDDIPNAWPHHKTAADR